MIEFEKLPPGCYMPEKETEEEEGDDSGLDESDSVNDSGQLIDGLQHMLDTWTAGQKKSSTRSAPASVIEGEPSSLGERVSIAAKCNSSDDLSKIGLDDDYNEDDDLDLLDTTLNNLSLDDSSKCVADMKCIEISVPGSYFEFSQIFLYQGNSKFVFKFVTLLIGIGA
ncbi:unnamed protein product [Strongylus vulgaris]|uniref:Uncharacterized protein n=1 Tax=Strongylus vulgaris TaxID=40348 RepID=A0A3P7IDE1_STRVU|nr:unnamed protein product [Strongylus vulgaris]